MLSSVTRWHVSPSPQKILMVQTDASQFDMVAFAAESSTSRAPLPRHQRWRRDIPSTPDRTARRQTMESYDPQGACLASLQPVNEPFSSGVCLTDLQYVDGLGELPGGSYSASVSGLMWRAGVVVLCGGFESGREPCVAVE